MKKKLSLIVLICLSLILTACSSNKKSESKSEKLNITTTFFPMYEFTKSIAGKYANVTMIMPNNIEPHDYEPSAKNIAQINDSNLFIYNSADMETWVPKVKKSAKKDSTTTFVEASKDIKLQTHDKHADPHVWLDPVLAKKEVNNIKDALIKADPHHKDYYEQRALAYNKKLDQLNQEFKELSQNAKRHTFIVQHEAFSYLASQYGLTQKSLTGISDTEEPSAKQLAYIESYMKEHDLHYIYTEEGISPKIANTIKDTTNAKLLTLNTLEQVSSKEIKNGATYFSLMQQNLEQLKKGLN